MANGNTIIPHGLRADLMRKHMENKNTLTQKGSLYIGTGEEYAENSPDYFGTVHCYKTAELTPIDAIGKPLVSKGKVNNVQQGIEWGQVSALGIANQAVIGCNGASSSFAIQVQPDIPGSGVGSSTPTTKALPLPGANHNSHIFYNSIGNDDIGARVITTGKLMYDCIKIGNQYYKLSANLDNYSGSPSLDVLTGMTQVEAETLSATDSITAPIITASNYFNATSDKRLKKNIQDYNPEASVLDVPVKQYEYKNTGAHSIGFIAQDLQALFPELVIEDADGMLGIQETKLVYLLMLEVKKLRDRVEELENK